MHIIEDLKWRYSVKTFDKNKKITEQDWSKIEEALLLSPSSFGLQPYKFLVITNPELKKQLREFAWNQGQIEDCSHLVVFCAKQNISKEYIESHAKRIAEVRNIPVSEVADYKGRMLSYFENGVDHAKWASEAAFLALGNILTVVAQMKIDACPIGGFIPAKFDEILQIEEGYKSVVVSAFGYRHNEDKYQNAKKVRFPVENLFKHYK